MQLRDSAKKGQQKKEDLIEKLSFEVVEPDELCQIALDLSQWLMFLKIIEINEIKTYNMPAKVFGSFNTQDRIDFMYRQLLTVAYPTPSLVQSTKKLAKLGTILKQLSTYA
jgi:hypothetical protein